MKKTLMIALAGMMMFAFTQCGDTKESKGQNDEQKNTAAQVTGSKEYVDYVNFVNEFTNLLKNGTDCEEIQIEFNKLQEKYDKDYDKKDWMTEEEEEKAEKLDEELDKLKDETADRLGCR